ncbi:MBL fold metallo-hydrolase [Kitasatospora sp. NPDC004240]
MTGNTIETVVTAALGDSSYLLASGDEAVVVDPQRDCWALLAACAERGLRIRYALDTHVHNDYLSGALEVRAATGATVAGPARAGYRFDHLPLAEGDELTVGDLRIQALETPGHTAEHTSYLVLDGTGDGAPAAVFTGGSLLVGTAGRTDLSGADRTEELARAQYRSLRRLAQLPPGTRVLPTHGAGSSCASGPASGRRTSTVGAQRTANPALGALDEEEFVAARLSGLPPAPAYYRQMGPLNRSGPAVLGGPPALARLTPEETAAALDRGALVIDARDRRAYADAHLPGALGDELDGSFAAIAGEVVPFGTPLVLVLPEPFADAVHEAVTQLLRIGYDHRLIGALDGGVERWARSGRPLASIRTADISEVPGAVRALGALVLDVRPVPDPPLPGATGIPLTRLPERIGELPVGREIWTVCGRGRRATVAAGLLAAAGLPVTAVASGGAPDLVRDLTRERGPDQVRDLTRDREREEDRP